MQPPRQVRTRDVCLSLKANALAVVFEEWAQFLQAQCGAELGVITQAGMGIQRQMGAVNRQIVLQQTAQ